MSKILYKKRTNPVAKQLREPRYRKKVTPDRPSTREKRLPLSSFMMYSGNGKGEIMAKKKTPLQRIGKLLEKLEALHEKENEIVEQINDIVEEENDE